MRKVLALAGSKHGKKGKRLSLEKVVVHSGYQSDEDPKPHDIALIFLRTPVELGSKMNTICLPNRSTRDRGVTVVSAGWGHERTKTTCMTNQMGPQLFKRCRTRRCITTEPPPITPLCDAFFRQARSVILLLRQYLFLPLYN